MDMGYCANVAARLGTYDRNARELEDIQEEKFPTLVELYSKCFQGKSFPAHDAANDTEATKQVFYFLRTFLKDNSAWA